MKCPDCGTEFEEDKKMRRIKIEIPDEPLKGKTQIPFRTGYIDHYHFYREDIRSAVEWLKQQLRNNHLKYPIGPACDCISLHDGSQCAYCELIDQAFEDVVKKTIKEKG